MHKNFKTMLPVHCLRLLGFEEFSENMKPSEIHQHEKRKRVIRWRAESDGHLVAYDQIRAV